MTLNWTYNFSGSKQCFNADSFRLVLIFRITGKNSIWTLAPIPSCHMSCFCWHYNLLFVTIFIISAAILVSSHAISILYFCLFSGKNLNKKCWVNFKFLFILLLLCSLIQITEFWINPFLYDIEVLWFIQDPIVS